VHFPVEKLHVAPLSEQQSACATQLAPASPQHLDSLLLAQRSAPQHPQLLPHGPWAFEQQYGPSCEQIFSTSSQARSPQHWRELVQESSWFLHGPCRFRFLRFFRFAATGSRLENPAAATTAAAGSASRRDVPDTSNLATASNRSPSMAQSPSLQKDPVDRLDRTLRPLWDNKTGMGGVLLRRRGEQQGMSWRTDR
jgi:hypothetical protein